MFRESGLVTSRKRDTEARLRERRRREEAGKRERDERTDEGIQTQAGKLA